MKVNLSYQVEFSKIPEEVNNRYLNEVRETLKSAYLDSLSIEYGKQNAASILNSLDLLISKTSEAADLITSATNIIIGYENEITKQQNVENQEQAQPAELTPEPEPAIETVDNLIEEYTVKDEVETDEH